MATLKPWYTVATPREDLREARPLDASEFAVHLDQVRDERAPDDYQKPQRFFDRTYLTQNLSALAVEVIRRLSGERTETSAVFNMTTQFGGGKTHALTLLYHLATHGPDAHGWTGVNSLLSKAGVSQIPKAATAAFVGTEFDSLTGRGGDDGTPVRRTPWGEIAFQLGGTEGLQHVARHEEQMVAPAGDVIRRFLPQNKPCLILMDELMNYVSRNRKSGLATQFYDFIQNLSETTRGENHVVLAVSIPASEMEMTAEDQADYDRLKKLLDRLGKAVIMSAETETSEIIRRRLFEWDLQAVGRSGIVSLDKDAMSTVNACAQWVVEHRQLLPSWFPVDHARDAFAATYPFHPMTFSVFERKWRTLARFQQTRGVLRILALWVAHAYQAGFTGAHRDPLIGLGTAPLDDSIFRAAIFEQIGEPRLEGAVTTDICGKQDSHALRLDAEAVDAIKKARLHQKIATTIFFESNGGQARQEATVPEIRMAVAEPGIDIGHIETVLDAMTSSSYFLSAERNRYRFSLTPNLNKLLADRRASISPSKIEERSQSEITKTFVAGSGVERVYFPEKSNQIPDRPALTLVVLSPDHSRDEESRVLDLISTMTRESGTSARTFKSALIWCLPESATGLREEVRKVLAWEAIDEESGELRFDEGQQRQLAENLKKAARDVREAVWRTYRNIVLLNKGNQLNVIDLGLIHSSAAESITALIINRLRESGDVEKEINPRFLVRNWPPAFMEWSTQSVRDAFFASPQFPRLLNAEAVKETIARGVSNGQIAYVGKVPDGGYDPFNYLQEMNPYEIEISEDMFIISKDAADLYKQAQEKPDDDEPRIGEGGDDTTGTTIAGPDEEDGPEGLTLPDDDEPDTVVTPESVITGIKWSGEIPAQKWTNFYMKVLTKYVSEGLKLSVSVEASSGDGISPQKIEETRAALRELGLDDRIETRDDG